MDGRAVPARNRLSRPPRWPARVTSSPSATLSPHGYKYHALQSHFGFDHGDTRPCLCLVPIARPVFLARCGGYTVPGNIPRNRRPEAGSLIAKGEPWWVMLAGGKGGSSLIRVTPMLVENLGSGIAECKVHGSRSRQEPYMLEIAPRSFCFLCVALRHFCFVLLL